MKESRIGVYFRIWRKKGGPTREQNSVRLLPSKVHNRPETKKGDDVQTRVARKEEGDKGEKK